MIKISIKTNRRTEVIDITKIVQDEIEKLNVRDGIVLIYVPHTTAGISINEGYDPAVGEDILNFLNKNIPKDGNYKHLEGNADAHIKSSLIGSSVIVILEDGKIKIGRWQGILFFEFDGPRTREIWIKLI